MKDKNNQNEDVVCFGMPRTYIYFNPNEQIVIKQEPDLLGEEQFVYFYADKVDIIVNKLLELKRIYEDAKKS